MVKKKVVCAWSSGKDSALALYQVLRAGEYEVTALLTTITQDYDRVSMHGVKRSLLQEQARVIGLPLVEVFIRAGADNRHYEEKMEEAMTKLKNQGVEAVIFADLFLQDVRAYRERNLSRLHMEAIFPLWGGETSELSRRFLALGFKAVVACVDTHLLDPSFCGCDYDERFLDRLPPEVDPCGENGEFHTFVHDGPIFKKPLSIRKGKRVLRDNRFCFVDFSPA